MFQFAFVGIAHGGADLSPDPVDWANISGASPAENANKTLTGFTGPLVVRATLSGVSITGGGPSGLQAYVNGVAGSSVSAANGATVDATVSPGQTLRYRATKGVAGSGTNWVGTVSVSVAATGQVIDTFTVNCDAAP